MKVAVTGASGHIGANLVRRLLDRGDRVRVLIHRSTRAIEGLDVEAVPGDVLNPDSLRSAFTGMDVVYHLAAVISMTGDPHGTMRAVNVDGAENVATASVRCGVGRMVYCSSVHAFDLRDGERLLDETGPRAADDPRRHVAYDRSKSEGERRVRAVIARGLDAVLAHPTAVIGPCDFGPSRMGRFFLRLYERSLPSLVRGSFDFVDVRDVADGLISAAERGRSGASYLMAGHYLSIGELATLAEEVTGRRPPRLVAPMWLARLGAPVMKIAARLAEGEPLYTAEALAALRAISRIDDTRARKDLDYAPRPTLETVRDIYRWFAREGRIPPDAVSGGARA